MYHFTGSFAKEKVPAHLRFIVSAESGINDGSAYPFVFFVLLLLQPVASYGAGTFAAHFIVITLLYEVVTAAALGFVLGWGAGLLHRKCHRWLENDSLLATSIVLALAILGAGKLLEMDGILACFVGGELLQ